MGDKSSALFQLKLYLIFKKGAHHSAKFQTFESAKFEEKLILSFKNDKNLVNFDLSTKKSKKFALWLVPFVQSIQRLT